MTPITTLKEFSRVLVNTGELDPSYVMLNLLRAPMGDDWVKRYCMAYLLFYHTGTAANAAQREGPSFWRFLEESFGGPGTRGTERRHFRGEAGWNALQFCAKVEPEALFDIPRWSANYDDFRAQIKRSGIPQFGDYFMWKWNDFSKCVFDDYRDMSRAVFFLPEPPRKAMRVLWPDRTTHDSFDYLCDLISDIPVHFGSSSQLRMCGPSEAETIACSLKSYVLKNPPTYIGEDIAEKHKQLNTVADPQLRAVMHACLPSVIQEQTYKVDKNAILESARVPDQSC